MKRFFTIILCMAGCILAADDDFKSLETFKARLPLYNKGRLQLFMYGDKVRRSGADIAIDGALLDIIKRNTGVDDIKYMDSISFYPISAPVATVAEFWKDKQHSDGLIRTKLAIVNQSSRIARGKDKVYFRSPSLDIDGIGFDAEYENRTVNIHRDVTIRIRMDKLGNTGTNHGRDRNIMVNAARMNLDFYANAVTVDGNVHVNVDDGKITIDCDKIIVFLSQDGKDTKEKDRKAPAPKSEKSDIRTDLGSFDGGGGRSVSRIECLGNVKVKRRLAQDVLQKTGRQEAEAGKATYYMQEGKIVLSGGRPVIHRGLDNVRGKKITLWRDSERMQVDGDCEFQVHVARSENLEQLADAKMKNTKRMPGTTHIFADFVDINYAQNVADFVGNVEIRDPQLSAESKRLKILLEEKPGSKAAKKDSLDIDNPGRQQKELSKIIFSGDVRTRNKKLAIFCEKMEMNIKEKATASKAKAMKSVLGSGNRQLTQVICTQNVRIISYGNKNKDRKKPDKSENSENISLTSIDSGKGGTADSDYARLELLTNQAYLQGKVRVEQQNVSLRCEKMHIIARELKPLTPEEAEDEEFMQRVTIGTERELEKIICIDDVEIIRRPPVSEDEYGTEKQRAVGDKAVLNMPEHKITLYGKDGRRPKLYRGPAEVEGKEIILWTDSEKLDIIEPKAKGIVIPKWE